MASTQPDIYTEEIYRINEPLTIVMSSPWETIPEAQRDLLSKILQAIGHDLAAVRIIQQSTFDVSGFARKPAHVIGFLSPPKGISMYEVYRTDQHAVVFSDGLEILLEDPAAKRKLWTALQGLFSA